MKCIATLLIFTITLSASSQQWKMSGSYAFGLPQQEMGKNIQPVHSLQGGILYQLPGKLKQVSVGAELGIGMYASKRIEQTFQFDNNTAAVVPVNYSSNTLNVNLQGRLNLLNNKNLVVPYVHVKGGLYKFFSSIYIDDPNNASSCHALVQKTIMKDNTLYWSAGGGLQIDPALFSRHKKTGRMLIDISASRIRGGMMEYINTKHLIDAQTISDPGAKPLNVEFINVSTQAIHEHTVAQVYTSPLRLLEFRAGMTLLLGKD